jgi:hypothetical protein
VTARVAWLLVAVALVAGCPAPTQYREVRPGLTCERATRVAHRTLVQLGYTVTEMVIASPARAGVLVGTKTLPDGKKTTGRVVITCDGSGASLQPYEDAIVPNYEFSRAFGYSFKVLVQRPDVEEPEKGHGLEILVHALTPQEAMLDLDGVPTRDGAIPVRLTIRNQTDRAVAIDPARIELVSSGGEPTGPLAGAALEGAIAPGPAGERVRSEPLRAGRVKANTTVYGYLVYPPGAYREARVTIEDVETGESEGFVTPVQ